MPRHGIYIDSRWSLPRFVQRGGNDKEIYVYDKLIKMYFPKTKEEKIKKLKEDLVKYETKLAFKMKNYRGVSHENALAELKHAEVTVLQAMVADIKNEIYALEKEV